MSKSMDITTVSGRFTLDYVVSIVYEAEWVVITTHNSVYRLLTRNIVSLMESKDD